MSRLVPNGSPRSSDTADLAASPERFLRSGRATGFLPADTGLWTTPDGALSAAQDMYRRVLGSWAMDLLKLRHRGQHIPRTTVELAAPSGSATGI